MVDLETARSACLKLPEVEEYDHFGKPAYRVKKKILATLWLERKRAVVKLSASDQKFFCDKYSVAIFQVKGGWGKYGWTNIELDNITTPVFSTALVAAWLNVAPKTMVKKYHLSTISH